jgi:beta-lactamase regulating signal transducer with metallopeptidase domain
MSFSLSDIRIDNIFDNLPKDDIQVFMNDFFKNKGIISQNPVDAENEKERLEKLKKLREEQKRTRKKVAITLAVIVGAFGALWFITQKVKK